MRASSNLIKADVVNHQFLFDLDHVAIFMKRFIAVDNVSSGQMPHERLLFIIN